jgi:hypothetical protein
MGRLKLAIKLFLLGSRDASLTSGGSGLRSCRRSSGAVGQRLGEEPVALPTLWNAQLLDGTLNYLENFMLKLFF